MSERCVVATVVDPVIAKNGVGCASISRVPDVDTALSMTRVRDVIVVERYVVRKNLNRVLV